MKTPHTPPRVGIIGGYGPATSASFCHRLVAYAQGLRRDFAPSFAMDSIPISMDSAERCIAGDLEATRDLVLAANAGIRRLASIGVSVIAVPCNSLHVLFPEFEKPAQLTVLHIAEVLARTLRARGYRRVAFLASGLTVKSGLYAPYFKDAGIDIVLPGMDQQNHINQAIASYVATTNVDAAMTAILIDIIRDMESQETEAIVLGCTDLAGLLHKASIAMTLPCVDSMDTLAEECARHSVE